MNTKGFTYLDFLVTLFIAVTVGTAITIASLRSIDSSKFSEQSRKITFEANTVLANISRRLSSGNISMISVRNCDLDDTVVCKEHTDIVRQKVPIKTLNCGGDGQPACTENDAPSYYVDVDGIQHVKYGACDENGDCREECYYEYYITPQDQLHQNVVCPETFCGDGTAQPFENCINCPYNEATGELDGDVTCPDPNDGLCTQTENSCNDYAECPGHCCGLRGCEAGENCLNCPQDCGSCGGNCFLKGTLVTMFDRTQKPIEDIQIGDHILSYDTETATFKKDTVTDIMTHNNTFEYLIINGRLKVTPNHIVLSEGKWAQVGKLRIGDFLTDSQGQKERIKTIAHKKEQVTTYNFEVNPLHVYIADGIIVHNSKGGSATGEL